MRPEPTDDMVERVALLASMTDSEKSVRNLVSDANLRLAGILLPHQSIGETEGPTADEIFLDSQAKVVRGHSEVH